MPEADTLLGPRINTDTHQPSKPQESCTGVYSQTWGSQESLQSPTLPYKTAQLGMEWDAQSKPDETEQVKFAMTSNCLQYPAHFVGVFLGPLHSPPHLSINDLNVNASRMILMDATGSGRKWVIQIRRRHRILLIGCAELLDHPRPGEAGVRGASGAGRHQSDFPLGVSLPLPRCSRLRRTLQPQVSTQTSV